MALEFSQDLTSITIGASQVTLYSEDQGACIAMGCLSRSQLSVGRSLRPIVCNMLDGIVALRPLSPSASLAVNAREISTLNLAVAGGSTLGFLSGSSIDTTVGTPGSASTLAAPCEWHVVKMPAASGAMSFAVNAENRDLWYASGTFVLNTDVSIYNAAYTNGDASVSVLAASLAYNTDGVTANTFWVSDPCLGKFNFTAIPDASLAQWTYDSTAQPFTINGVKPLIDSDVRHGDTVALIGLAYKWGSVLAADGTQVPTANRVKIQFDGGVPKPMGIKLVHEFEYDRTKKLFIARLWQAVNMNGFSTGFDSQSGGEVALDMMFTALNDKANHPNSAFCEIEIVNSPTALSATGHIS